jgi:hypothetical protein
MERKNSTMKKASIIIPIFLTMFFVLKAHAEQNTIRLICKHSHTIDATNGKSSGTTGEDLVTVKYLDNGDAIIRKEGLGAVFIGTISDEKIYGETEYEISGSKIQQTIMINRYTGAFEITFKITGSDGGLIHCGTCEQVVKKKF